MEYGHRICIESVEFVSNNLVLLISIKKYALHLKYSVYSRYDRINLSMDQHIKQLISALL